MRLDEFFLVFHFVDAYGPRLRAMAAQGGALASKLLLIDLDELLDPARLIRRERERVARETQRLDSHRGVAGDQRPRSKALGDGRQRRNRDRGNREALPV